MSDDFFEILESLDIPEFILAIKDLSLLLFIDRLADRILEFY